MSGESGKAATPEKSYKDLMGKINSVCVRYGFTQCDQCPLFQACIVERDFDSGETQTEFTKRWEQGMAQEFVKQFPNMV